MTHQQNKGSPAAAGWIADGEKYAFIGLEVKVDEDIPLTRLTATHWVTANSGFVIPGYWCEWLGTICTEDLI